MTDHKQTVYLFSGLGVDERAFQSLDLSHYNTALIRWVPPLQHETMADYALRLCEQIHEKNPILIGISFGGMVAVEVAKHLPVKKIFLIASAQTRNELPAYYRLAGKLKLPQIVRANWIKQPNFLTYWLFGARTRSDKQLLRSILKDTDPVFLKWALIQIANWENTLVPAQLVHIHGTRDRILPFRKTKSAVPIEGGGHFMSITKSEAISRILQELFNEER